MASTLSDVQRAVKGLIVMTGDLDAMFNSLLNNQTPEMWEKVAYPSLKPLSSWFEDLLLRVEFYREWIEQGPPNAYWISAMYFPQGFLTSILQGHSRGKKIPVDKLSFEYSVEDTDDPAELEGPADDGIYIHGLFMD